ncbi:MAG: C25 family cysteine peptidase [Tepidisphaerales bacterium]
MAQTLPPQWIVAVAPDFRQAVEPLAKQRLDQGLHPVIVQTNDILTADEIRAGKAVKLRDHLHKLCRQSAGASYILLVGTTQAADPKDAAGTVVPPLTGTTGRMAGQPSDNAYGCLGADLLPTVAVGRLPARTVAEARQMVEKILAFERDSERRLWQRQITLLVGDPGGVGAAERTVANFYVNTACQGTSDLLHPAWDVRAIFHIPGSVFYVPDEKLHEQSLEYLSQGQAFTFFLGHSNAGGLWSNNARFLDRDDFASLKIPRGPGILATCGCYACQLPSLLSLPGRGQEGYGLAAMRNPAGPVAVMGANGESYAAMGQLAFDGLLNCFAGPGLPPHLGDCWLQMKTGLAKGNIGFLTFKMFDYADGSRGAIPLATQRLEHLEMWMLLGDPAMRLPPAPAEIRLQTPPDIAQGASMNIRGTLPAGFADTPVRVSLLRPMSGRPLDLQPLPDAPPDARAQAILANHAKANDRVLLTKETPARNGQFEVKLDLPASLPWPRLILRAQATSAQTDALGAVLLSVRQAQTR